MQTDTPQLIIPAAGYGKRVGAPLAKEMALDAATGEPLIAKSFRWANRFGYRALVVTRPEKVSLIEFARSRGAQVELIESSTEWPESLLKVRGQWAARNILVLPDTVFSPEEVIEDLANILLHQKLAHAVFRVPDASTWGVVEGEGAQQRFCEKPIGLGAASAWGLIAFRKGIGVELFENLLTSTLHKQWFKLSCPSVLVPLASFADLTRINT